MAATAEPRRVVAFLLAFAVAVSLALKWAYLFSESRELTWAAVSQTSCATVTIVMVIAAFADRWWLGALLLP